MDNVLADIELKKNGFTYAVIEIGGSSLDVYYPINTDLDSRFRAVCNDTGEILSISGWFIESVELY